jgi:integrase
MEKSKENRGCKVKEQKGCIYVARGNWAIRWRETVSSATGIEKRKVCFKVLGPVTAEHERNKDRSTGKLRVPREIRLEAERVMQPVNSGQAVSVLMAIGELVERHYFPEAFSYLKPSTQKGYRDIWKLHLRDRVGETVTRDFQRADAFMLWKQITKSNPSLTKRTMQHVRFFLSGVFEFAKNRGWYAGENPCNADLPEGLPKGKETGFYSVEDVGKMLTLLANIQAQAVVALAFGSGLRKGEIAGLRWEDYESMETGAVIHVRRSVWNGKSDTTKNESSAADANLDAAFCQYIEAYRAFCGGVTEGFMFGYSAEHPVNMDSFAKWKIKPVLKAAGIEWKGWHAFRRGNATFLAKYQGAEVAAVMLRHSSVATTQAHYIKDTAQDRRAALAKKAEQIEGQRQAAAESLGDGLKRATVQ